MTDPILKPVIEIMQKEGVSEDRIADTVGGLIKASTAMLYQQAMETFSDEDMQQIESAPNDETANKLIVDLYAQRVGTSAEELMNIFLKKFVEEFIKNY